MGPEVPTPISSTAVPPGPGISSVWRSLASVHDAITWASFIVGAALVAFMAVSVCYEVVARYAFNAPTSWASAFVSYALCIAIFVAMPELTRTGAHVAINLLVDKVSSVHAAMLARVIQALAAVACLFAAAICANESWHQYIEEIETIAVYPVPKWLVTVFIPYGMLSAGIYFIRHLCGERVADGRGSP